ncbi:MAG: ATP-binding protein [Candidatus Electrothrix sp. Rat3]|nr:ATP-binding protein [Candidatus Electrothrix rattekaaiensis]
MKIKKIIIENFRGYKKRTVIDLNNFIVFVGKNDAGKSTILEALDIFFGNSNPDSGDACVSGDATKVRIGCVFTDFPSELVIDSSNSTSLEKEYLLNIDGDLEIHKIYNCTSPRPKCNSAVAIANHPLEPSCFKLLEQSINNLRNIAKKSKIDLSNIDQTRKADLRQAIRESVDNLELSISEVSLLKKVDGQTILDNLEKHFPIYALFKSDRPSTDQDAEAQDPMKMAVKSAIKEQEEKLVELTEIIKKQVQKVAEKTVEKVQEFSEDLANTLTPKVVNKNWDTLFSVSLTGDDEIPVNKRGSGVRRLILLSFFRAQAEQEAVEAQANGIIYAIEEPETSQHPKNQKLLLDALLDLVENQGCQIMLTTHTPVLIRNLREENLRFIKQNEEGPYIEPCDETNSSEIVESLGVLPDHSVKVFFGVEGRNDINFLKTISKNLSKEDLSIPDLAKAEDEGRLVFIPLGGSSLDLWVSRINGLNRPQFYLMDRDNEPPKDAKYQSQFDSFKNEGHNAWITKRLELENYIHPDLIKADYTNYSGGGRHFENVPRLFAQAIHENSGSTKSWQEVILDKEKLKKKESKAKKKLNSIYASKMTKELLDTHDPDGELISWLQDIGAAL